MNNDVDELYEKLGLKPFDEFSTEQRAVNLSHPETYRKECDGFRQTGRTTRQLCKAIAAALRGYDVEYLTYNRFSLEFCRDKAAEMLSKLGESYSIAEDDILVGPSTISFKRLGSSKKVYFEPAFNDL